jgi:phosphoribosylamine--glycine ligase
MAANGYPGEPTTGSVIGGLEQASAVPGALVFHAATRLEDGHVVASGGRVLTLCGTGPDAAAARATAYAAVAAVKWPGGFCRSDIGL